MDRVLRVVFMLLFLAFATAMFLYGIMHAAFYSPGCVITAIMIAGGVCLIYLDLRFLLTPIRARREYIARFANSIDLKIEPITAEGPAVLVVRFPDNTLDKYVNLAGSDVTRIPVKKRVYTRRGSPPYEYQFWINAQVRWSVSLEVCLYYPEPSKVSALLFGTSEPRPLETKFIVEVRGRCRVIELPSSGYVGDFPTGFPVIPQDSAKT